MGVARTGSAFALLCLLIAACGGGEKASSDFIPDVPILCDSGQNADCGGDQLPVFVGLIEALPDTCENFLFGMNATQRRTSFLASGSAVAGRSGIYLRAWITAWEGPYGGSIDVLDPGDYQVCAFIDTNEDGDLDMNEPIGTGQLTVGRTGFELNNWQ